MEVISNFLTSSANASELANGIENIEVSSIQVVGTDAAGYSFGDKSNWLFGENNGVIIGGDENNWLLHTGSGEAIGGAGDDILIGLGADYIRQGEYINGVDGPTAQTDLRLTLNGGEGDDYLVALGGRGANDNDEFIFEEVA